MCDRYFDQWNWLTDIYLMGTLVANVINYYIVLNKFEASWV